MINTDNYELYFLQYLEGELGAEERQQVEVFAAEHPELGEELALAAEAPRLSAEMVTYDDKEGLRRRPVVWPRYAAAAVVAGALLMGGMHLMRPTSEPTPPMVAQTVGAEKTALVAAEQPSLPSITKVAAAKALPSPMDNTPYTVDSATESMDQPETKPIPTEMAAAEEPLLALVEVQEPIIEEEQALMHTQAPSLQGSRYADCEVVVRDYSNSNLFQLACEYYPEQTEQLSTLAQQAQLLREEINNNKIIKIIRSII